MDTPNTRIPLLPHATRGEPLSNGRCVHCGTWGCLEDEECPVRLRHRLDLLADALEVARNGESAPPWLALATAVSLLAVVLLSWLAQGGGAP